MAYTKTTWVNNGSPYINADNLNHMEEGIYTNSTDVATNTSNITTNSSKFNYSTDETVVGKWINDKPIYRKVIYISSLPNNTQTDISVSSMNIEQFVDVRGIATNGMLFGGTRTSDATAPIDIVPDLSQNRIQIATYRNRSSVSAYLIIEYTKTSD